MAKNSEYCRIWMLRRSALAGATRLGLLGCELGWRHTAAVGRTLRSGHFRSLSPPKLRAQG